MLWPLQVLTHSFGHINALHVMANVSGLGLLSCYERRVGARRYLAVFAVACASAMLALFFYPVPTAISGISGGLYGLAAAYFTDNAELALKDWLSFIAMFVGLAILLAWGSEVQMSKDSAASFRIDHIGHAFGALGAIAYCRIKPAACL